MGKKSRQKGKVGETCENCDKVRPVRNKRFCSLSCRSYILAMERSHFEENATLVPTGTKRCSQCNRIKGLHLFYKHQQRFDGFSPMCKACHKKHYPLNRSARRRWELQRKYGITVDEYELLLESQAGKCAICGGGTTKDYLAVDHDHKTGEVRGLLCARCNTMLGRQRDRVEVFDIAAAYLRQPPSRAVLGERDWGEYRGYRR